jgi:hypothetical protein
VKWLSTTYQNVEAVGRRHPLGMRTFRVGSEMLQSTANKL